MPKKSDTTEPLPKTADTMEQAAAMLGLPIGIIRYAKKRGCPAFRGSRVYLDELTTWLEGNRADLPSEDDADGMSKERVDVLLKLARLEEQNIINAKLRDELMPIKDVCERLRKIGEELKSTLHLRLVDQLPALNAGLDAPKQRENNREVVDEICRRFQSWAREYDELLRKSESRKAEAAQQKA